MTADVSRVDVRSRTAYLKGISFTGDKETLSVPDNSGTDANRISQDTLAVSSPLKTDLQSDNNIPVLNSGEINEYSKLLWEMNEAKKQAEEFGKGLEVLRKCLIISMLIIAGDIVSLEDHRFLRENEPEMYFKAITLRRVREDPREYKRISEEKDCPKKPVCGTEIPSLSEVVKVENQVLETE